MVATEASVETCPVGVLDAKHEAPAMAPGEEPAEERGARAADVQVSGRARSEAGAYLHRPLRIHARIESGPCPGCFELQCLTTAGPLPAVSTTGEPLSRPW